MKALRIAIKDVQILFKDRGSVIMLFVLPLVFIIIFSGALSAIGSGEADTRVPLPLVDLDGGTLAQTLAADIDAAGGVRVEPYPQEEALALLDEHKIDRVLIIPAGFSAALAANEPTTLRLVSHPNAPSEVTEAVRLVIDGVARDMELESQIVASLQRVGEMQANAPEEFQAFSTENIVAQAREQFARAQEQPLITVEQKIAGQTEETAVDLEELGGMAAPGFAVLFVFLTAQSTARTIYEEKKVGAFRRLLAAPLSKATLLGGKMILNMIIGLLQIALIFAFGSLGMQLLGLTPMPLGNAPLAVLLVALLVALCSSSLGVFIAALARTENQIGGLSSLLLWGLGILSIVPPFILETFGPLPRIIPHVWASAAFDSLLLRGQGLVSVVPNMLVLLGFSAVFFAIGLWRFDFN